MKKSKSTNPEKQEDLTPDEETPVVETSEETTESPSDTPEETPDVEVLDTEVVEEEAPKADPPPEDDRLLRLAAEYDNFRKRTIKEKVTLRDTALRETAIEFLPVYDNLERALKQETEDAAYKKGVEMTMTQLKTIFEKLELEKIPSLGELFDPNLHNAVTHVDDDRWGENTITEVFQEGFTHKDTVIRFAMVKVAN